MSVGQSGQVRSAAQASPMVTRSSQGPTRCSSYTATHIHTPQGPSETAPREGNPPATAARAGPPAPAAAAPVHRPNGDRDVGRQRHRSTNGGCGCGGDLSWQIP
ncbi:hypothetical protein PLESTM_001158200 [Pleodorina starrii]|nr:hypothetical protein PLESTM_001158200 [Pleodorina starrii]